MTLAIVSETSASEPSKMRFQLGKQEVPVDHDHKGLQKGLNSTEQQQKMEKE